MDGNNFEKKLNPTSNKIVDDSICPSISKVSTPDPNRSPSVGCFLECPESIATLNPQEISETEQEAERLQQENEQLSDQIQMWKAVETL